MVHVGSVLQQLVHDVDVSFCSGSLEGRGRRLSIAGENGKKKEIS